MGLDGPSIVDAGGWIRGMPHAWLVLSLALYEIVTNFFESTWLRGSDPVWVAFVIVVAEIGRYWHPLPPRGRSQYLAGRAVASNAVNAGLYRRKGTEMVRRSLCRITSQTGDSCNA